MEEQRRICIVNNDTLTRQLLKDFFSQYPCIVDETVSPEEAVELVSSNRYNLVFVDHALPSMNGAELTKKLKDITGNTVVIGMSASDRDKESFDEAGADHFLAKPFNFKTLTPSSNGSAIRIEGGIVKGSLRPVYDP